MHYFFVRVWFVKIFFLIFRVDPRLKNEVYMQYFFWLSLVNVKAVLSPNVTCELILNNEVYLYYFFRAVW